MGCLTECSKWKTEFWTTTSWMAPPLSRGALKCTPAKSDPSPPNTQLSMVMLTVSNAALDLQN
jgi:hypothetical protein